MFFKTRKRILFGDWIWDWLDYKKNYIKESTYANYSTIISNHIIPALGKYYLFELDNKLIQQFLLEKCENGRLDNSGGLAHKTIRDIISVIKSSLKFAVKEGCITNINLDFVYPKGNKKEKVYTLSRREQGRLTDYILENQTLKNLGILLTLYSGIRIGELCALKWKDIDFKSNILHINKTLQRVYIKNPKLNISKVVVTNPKTHNAERDIPLNKSFAQKLRSYKTNDEDYILSGTEKFVEPRTYRRHFAVTLEKAHIRKVNFHGLRHTFATNCIDFGIDYKTVSELLGHSTVNITLNLYVHPQMSQKKKCINLICKAFEEKTVA
ncbi:MAG: site-specific integrase [Clostridia bacterium]|nr:site-specific integrase [Clostridia bacterium]